ncbi:hypothetical protein HRI_000648300 [Hibiscus trionum]|uniref:Uncharacterized protein n=1 Tax=Hibiscus trionum TaxID=183268 RepID=A0A9W7H5J3_HIBTR|nr:hypothetical protein HRI_000648300 [Hibiscus trionum]
MSLKNIRITIMVESIKSSNLRFSYKMYILTMNMERDLIAFLLEVMAVSQRRKTKTWTFVLTRQSKWRYKLKLLKSMETSF